MNVAATFGIKCVANESRAPIGFCDSLYVCLGRYKVNR